MYFRKPNLTSILLTSEDKKLCILQCKHLCHSAQLTNLGDFSVLYLKHAEKSFWKKKQTSLRWLTDTFTSLQPGPGWENSTCELLPDIYSIILFYFYFISSSSALVTLLAWFTYCFAWHQTPQCWPSSSLSSVLTLVLVLPHLLLPTVATTTKAW